jgi:cobalt-zinc-cadmium efflux system membrane fusion protein
MSNPTQPEDHQKNAPDSVPATVTGHADRTVSGERSFRRGKKTIVVVVFATIAVAGLALLTWKFWPTTAGRPVPAPRTLTTGETNTAGATVSSAEPSISLSPELIQRAGINIESVGEQPAAEAPGQQSTGVVQANAYRETPVISLVGGIVRSVAAELGKNVRRGEPLVVVTSSDLADAQSRYLKASADLDEHHQHHGRTARLVEIGAASREEFEQATARLRSDEAEVAAQRHRLLQLGLSPQRVDALRSSSQVSSEVTIPAPVSGTVTARSVNPGEVVEANKELMKVTDLSTVWVIGQVYEKDLARIRVGSGASISSEAYPGRLFRGKVSYVDPHIDAATRTAQVRIDLANLGQILKIGMFVNVAFATVTGSESTVPVIPTSAVQNVNNQQVVFVATGEPNVFVMRPIRVGVESNGYLPVQEGLRSGERIVTTGSFLLRAEWLKTHPGAP